MLSGIGDLKDDVCGYFKLTRKQRLYGFAYSVIAGVILSVVVRESTPPLLSTCQPQSPTRQSPTAPPPTLAGSPGLLLLLLRRLLDVVATVCCSCCVVVVCVHRWLSASASRAHTRCNVMSTPRFHVQGVLFLAGTPKRNIPMFAVRGFLFASA